MTPEPVRVRPVHLRSYPIRDRSFASALAAAVDTAVREGSTASDLPERVQDLLRGAYPDAVVRLQEPLARLVNPISTLYAYRDGQIRPEDLRREQILDALEAAPDPTLDTDEPPEEVGLPREVAPDPQPG